MNKPLWGIDLGGTKIEGAILPSLDNPVPLLRTRIDTEGAKGYEHIVGQVHKLVQMMMQQSGLTPQQIGFGTPGVLDPLLLTMKNCNSTALNGRPLKKDLEEKLQLPVSLANDANCFALAETHWGIVQGIAGEWGHNFLDASGGPCYCGKNGCVETVLSGPALQRYYEQLTGTKFSLKEIVSHFRQGDDNAALETINRLNNFFGKAVSAVINLLDPDVIVVGGGVGNIDTIYTAGLESVKQHIFNNRVDVPILKPSLGDSAGVFGAAALVA